MIGAIMPVKGRPDQTLYVINRLIRMSGLDDDAWRLVLVVDDDPALRTALSGQSLGANVMMVATAQRVGYWRAFGGGILHAMKSAPSPITHVCNLANDLLPGAHWLRRMQSFAEENNQTGLTAFNDGIHAGDHAAHFYVNVDTLGRWYPRAYSPYMYDHMYGDAELTARAKAEGIFAAQPWAVLYHNHVYLGARNDEIYALGHQRIDTDKALFEARKAQGWNNEHTTA